MWLQERARSRLLGGTPCLCRGRAALQGHGNSGRAPFVRSDGGHGNLPWSGNGSRLRRLQLPLHGACSWLHLESGSGHVP